MTNTGELHAQIMRDRYGPKLREYIMEKFEWDHHQMAQTDWAAVQTAFSRKTFHQQTKISKVVYSWNPAMVILHNITPNDYPHQCATYARPKRKRRTIFFTCNNQASRSEQINTLRIMEKEAKEAGINMFLIQTFTKGIHAWIHNLSPPDISQKTHPVHKLV